MLLRVMGVRAADLAASRLVNDSTSRQPSPVPVSLKTHAAKRTVDGDSEPIDEPDTEDQEISDKAAEAVIERQARPISANEGELAAQDLPVNRNVWQSANEVDPQSVDVAIEVNPSDQASDVEMEAGKAEGIEAGVILMERAGTFIGSHLIQRREFPEDPLIADSQEGPALALDLQAVYEVDEDDGLQEDDLGVEVDDSGFYDAHDVSVLHDKRMGKIVEIDNEDSEAGSRHEADEELEADEVLVPGTSQPDDADELYEQQGEGLRVKLGSSADSVIQPVAQSTSRLHISPLSMLPSRLPMLDGWTLCNPTDSSTLLPLLCQLLFASQPSR